MNIKEYISSGIVESYVLGLADAAERAEFESMCAKHAEVKAARDAFEVLLEQQAFMNVIEPPADLQNKIFAEIETEVSSPSSLSVPFTKKNTGGLNIKTQGSLGWMRFAVAASVILLIASGILNLYLYRQRNEYLAQYQRAVQENTQIQLARNALQTQVKNYKDYFVVLTNPKMTVVKMPGSNVPTSPAPNSLATVYWNTENKEVYLSISNMPQPVAGKQYQLWALVDGKPVDAGVFDTPQDFAVIKMKNIPNAQGFAITLEKRGGSPSPTMQQMFVLGNVKT